MNTAGELVRFLTLYGRPPPAISLGVEFQWEPIAMPGNRPPIMWFVARSWDPADLHEQPPRDAANDRVALW